MINAQSDLCPTVQCNCTLTNGIILDISCDQSVVLTTLPTLSDASQQVNVQQISVRSWAAGNSGPLISLPTNLCSAYPNAAILDFSNNNIAGILNTTELACLQNTLIEIHFSENLITGVDDNFFQENQRLTTIDLSYNSLTRMPVVSQDTFVNFPSSISLINLSFNQIVNADLWPLFVRTGIKYCSI